MSNPIDDETYDEVYGQDRPERRAVRNGNPGRPQREFEQPVPPEGDYPPEPEPDGSDSGTDRT
jgi:hypothetical protein